MNHNSTLQTSAPFRADPAAPVNVAAECNSPFSFEMGTSDATTGQHNNISSGKGYPQSVTISPVPLPASFALMLAGFGGLVALRRAGRRGAGAVTGRDVGTV